MERASIEPSLATPPPWLRDVIQREDVTDICINGPHEIYADWGHGMQRVSPPTASWPTSGPTSWNEDHLRSWVLDQLAQIGKRWDARHPFVDAALPSGHRLHVAFPPLARQGILVSLRRLPSATPSPNSSNSSLKGLHRWSSCPFLERLVQAVRDGESVLIAGATGSGKTTLANDLLSEVPSHERILALEDTPELRPQHPHFVSLISRPPNADGCGEVTLRTLLKQSLRMRPDRIILGECRGPEVLDLLQTLNTGHRGSMATLHANSPRDALRRIELLCLLAAGGSIPLPAIRELVGVGVQWIAQVGRTHAPNGSNDGSNPRREILELCRVEGREGDTILLRPMVKLPQC